MEKQEFNQTVDEKVEKWSRSMLDHKNGRFYEILEKINGMDLDVFEVDGNALIGKYSGKDGILDIPLSHNGSLRFYKISFIDTSLNRERVKLAFELRYYDAHGEFKKFETFLLENNSFKYSDTKVLRAKKQWEMNEGEKEDDKRIRKEILRIIALLKPEDIDSNDEISESIKDILSKKPYIPLHSKSSLKEITLNTFDELHDEIIEKRIEKWAKLFNSIGSRLPTTYRYDFDEGAYLSTDQFPLKLRFSGGQTLEITMVEAPSDRFMKNARELVDCIKLVGIDSRGNRQSYPLTKLSDITSTIRSPKFLLEIGEELKEGELQDFYNRFLRDLAVLDLDELDTSRNDLGDFTQALMLSNLLEHFTFEESFYDTGLNSPDNIIRALSQSEDIQNDLFSLFKNFNENLSSFDIRNLVHVILTMDEYPYILDLNREKDFSLDVMLESINEFQNRTEFDINELLKALDIMEEMGLVKTFRGGRKAINPLLKPVLSKYLK